MCRDKSKDSIKNFKEKLQQDLFKIKRLPGFLNALQMQLESLDPDVIERVSRHGGLQIRTLIDNLLNPPNHTVYEPGPPDDSAIVDYNNLKNYSSDGKKITANGQVAVCILAGGAGTRAGGPKCLMKISEKETLLSRKIRLSSGVGDIWIILTRDLIEPVRTHLKDLNLLNENVKLIEQFESVRLTPLNQLFFTEKNEPSLYPCGHGDAISALVHENIIKNFREKGGKYFYIMNVDNYNAKPDDAIIGYHHSSGADVSCEIVKKDPKEIGGLLCKYEGINQVVEAFRFSLETNLSVLNYMNTNTMIVNVDLEFDKINWSWHRVGKSADGKAFVQYERLLQQLTACFETKYIVVDRDERFLPIKSASDLDRIKNA